jgi:hypothetical protein
MNFARMSPAGQTRVGQRSGSTFQMTTTPNPAQHRALELLQAIAV